MTTPRCENCRHKNKERDVMKAVNDGVFQIKPNGEIWRTGKYSRTRNVYPVNPKPTGWKEPSGYIRIRASGGSAVFCYAHRIIWQYFFGDIPNGFEINHIDGNKSNNIPANLELVTRSENIRHTFRMGLQKKPKGSRKLNWGDVGKIREIYLDGNTTQAKLAKQYGVSEACIRQIVSYKTWIHRSQALWDSMQLAVKG